MRVLLVHANPREGGDPTHCDRLVRIRPGYAIEWSVPLAAVDSIAPESDGVSLYSDAPSALGDWYLFPRQGERQVGRFPRGFGVALRSAKNSE